MTPLQKAEVELLTKKCEKCGNRIEWNEAIKSDDTLCAGCAINQFDPKRETDRYKVSGATLGAIHELAVAADLMKRGFSVFRSLSPNAACDLVAAAGSDLYRIEVTTGYRTGRGRVFWPYHNPEKHDVLAVVCDGEIEYRPPIIEWRHIKPS